MILHNQFIWICETILNVTQKNKLENKPEINKISAGNMSAIKYELNH